MKHARFSIVVLLALFAFGCGDKDKKTTKTGESTPTASLPADLIVAKAPGEPKDIIAVRKDAKEGDEVILRGVIGGEIGDGSSPFLPKLAMLRLIDLSLPSCKDNGESCPTPWDYCCVPEEEQKQAAATVQVVDAQGAPLKVGLNSGEKLKPYDVVIVRGKVGSRTEGNLTVNATAIYVQGQKN